MGEQNVEDKDVCDSDSQTDVSSSEGKQSKETERLELELAESKDKYLRLLAEQENTRRRWEKEKSDIKKFGIESIVRDLLPILDSFEQALLPFEKNEQTEEMASFVEGFSLVKRQMHDALSKHGLELISAAGQNFDPNLHQAIQMIEFEHVDSHRVHQEYQRGYLLNGRLVRPAMVSVAVPSVKKSGSPQAVGGISENEAN